MGLSTRLVVSGAVAGVALTYYMRSCHRRTGEGYLDIIRQLPGAALRWVDNTRERTMQAIEDGKVAARRRDSEIAGRLQAASPPQGA